MNIRNEPIPLFQNKAMVGLIAEKLTLDDIGSFAATCRHVKAGVDHFWDNFVNNSYRTLTLLAQFDARLIAKFLDRFFWDDTARENKLKQKLESDPRDMATHALYALFAPREYIIANRVKISQSLKFLVQNQFPLDCALLLSLDFIVQISKPGSVNLDLLPLEEVDVHMNLRGAQLDNAQLQYRQLAYANLSDASCNGTFFARANLRGVNFRRATLSRAVFLRADLSEANLSFAKARRLNLLGTNLSDANLCNADLLFPYMVVRPPKALYCKNDMPMIESVCTIFNGSHYNSKTRFGLLFSKKNNGLIEENIPKQSCCHP